MSKLLLVRPSLVAEFDEVCTQFEKGSFTRTYVDSEGRLGLLPLSVAEFDKVCTQFEKSQLYTYLGR